MDELTRLCIYEAMAIAKEESGESSSEEIDGEEREDEEGERERGRGEDFKQRQSGREEGFAIAPSLLHVGCAAVRGG
jgi:hypothetical protein